jgi:hypothetical protein
VSDKPSINDANAKSRALAEIQALNLLDSPEVCAAMRSIVKAELVLRGLSPTQERRAIARLEGQSIREIAKAEGRAPSTVAETLAAPSVRARIAAELRLIHVNKESLLRAVLRELVTIALEATKLGPFGRSADYRTRLDACVKVLHYYDASDGASPEPPHPVLEQSAVERSITATERRVTTRTKPGRNPGGER